MALFIPCKTKLKRALFVRSDPWICFRGYSNELEETSNRASGHLSSHEQEGLGSEGKLDRGLAMGRGLLGVYYANT